MKRTIGLAFCLGAAATAISCRPAKPPQGERKLVVAVSVLPQAYFVERIGGGHVEVEVIVGPGQNPHAYEPTPRQVVRLGEAKLYFRIGEAFEGRLAPKLASAHPDLRIVDGREGMDLLPAPEHEEGHEGHDHDEHTQPAHGAHGHDADDMDTHVYMSPRLAKRMAETMAREMAAADPDHAAEYQANLRALEADLDALDAELARTLAPLKGKAFYVFHPAFGYLAAGYGLRQQAVETGGKSPSARHVKDLIDRARAEGVKVIFVQPQFSQEVAQAVAEQIGGAVVPIDPLAKDYLANLRDVADKIRQALAPKVD